MLFLALAALLTRSSGFYLPLAVAGAAVLVLAVQFAPDVYFLLTPLAFVLAATSFLNPGHVFQILRWVFLLLLGISIIPRGGLAGLPRMRHPAYLSLALFMGVCFCSVLYSPNGAMSLLKSLAFGFLLFVALLYGAVSRPQEREGVCSSFGLLAILVVLACGVAFARGDLAWPGGNFAGIFGKANALGAFLGVAAPFLLFRIERVVQPDLVKRAVAAVLFLAAVVFLLASHSRAGIGAAALACGWWLFFTSRRAVALLLAGAALAVFVGSQFYPSYSSGIEQQYVLKTRKTFFQSRDMQWKESLATIEESPLFGIGFGVSRGDSQAWRLSFKTGKWAREKGSSYLAVAGEVGLVGALLLLLPVAWVLVRAGRWLDERRRKKKMDVEFFTTLVLSACLIGGLTDAFAEAWLTAAGFFCTVIFWLAFGMLAARMLRQWRRAARW